MIRRTHLVCALAYFSLGVACGSDSIVVDAGPDGSTDGTTQQDSSTQDSGQDSSTTDASSKDVATDAPSDAASGDGGLAALCTSTGGTVGSALCCGNTNDFPSTCATGPCGCSPQSSHQVQICNCPTTQCFTPQQGCH